MQKNVFSWKTFLSKQKIRRPKEKSCWREVIGSMWRDVQKQMLTKLLCLAYFDGLDTNQDRKRDTRYLDSLANRCGFSYYDVAGFGRAGGQCLSKALGSLGCVMLQSGGKYQYRRTILRYSGSMYLAFAHRIADIVRSSSWNLLMEHDFIKQRLEREFSQYFGEGEEDEKAQEDLIDFFQTLAKQYRKYNAPFTREDVQSLAPLTDAVADRIIFEMCRTDENQSGSMSQLDTLPTLALNSQGEAVFTLPQEGHFGDGVKSVAFLFRESASSRTNVAFASYRKLVDGTFKIGWQEGFEEGVPVERIRSIVRRYGTGGVDEEVIPLNFREGGSHVLLRVVSADTDCGYIIDESGGKSAVVSSANMLSGGASYKVVSLSGERLRVLIDHDGEGQDFDQARYEAEAVITVPLSANAVIVGDVEYQVANDVNKYFDLDARAECIFRPGGRLFYTKKSTPFSDLFYEECEDVNSVYAWYECEDHELVKLPKGDEDWDVPKHCMWQKGWVSFRREGKQLFRRAVTFIEDFECEDLDENYDLEESVEAVISFSDGEQVEARALPRDSKVRFLHNGFLFSLPVKRIGVFFETTDMVIPIPKELPGGVPYVHLAEKDFQLKCRVLTGDEDAIINVTRGGNTWIKIDGNTFTGTEIMAQPSIREESSDFYCVCVNINDSEGLNFHKFHVYDPITTFVGNDASGSPRRVLSERQGNDLKLTYFIAACDAGKPKTIAYYPAHRQDQPMVCFDPTSSLKPTFVFDKWGRCKETTVIPDFYAANHDWGAGLLCFVARKRTHPKLGYMIEAYSAGFFLPPPDERLYPIDDDPYCIRTAMAKKDYVRIEAILRNPSTDAESYLGGEKGFLRRLQIEAGRVSVSSRSGRDFFNSFRNILKRPNGKLAEISGYLFTAGWYCLPKMGVGYLPDGMRGYWSRLMFSYDELISRGLISVANGNIDIKALSLLPRNEKVDLREMVKRVAEAHQIDIHKDDYICQFEISRTFSFAQLAEEIRRRIEDAEGSFHISKLLVPLKDNITDRVAVTIKICNQIIKCIANGWISIINGKSSIKEMLNEDGQYRITAMDLLKHNGVRKMLQHHFDNYKDLPYIFAAGYPVMAVDTRQTRIKGISYVAFEDYLNYVGMQLHVWRKNPTLEKGQGLREALLKLEQFDESVRGLYRQGAIMGEDGEPLSERAIKEMPLLTEYVNATSWKLRIAEEKV